jgi:tRNA 2-thiouridine synthesizing protein A
METHILDTSGLKCPQPVLKIAMKATELKEGEILEVIADCPTFEKDVKKWCARLKKTILFIRNDGDGKVICQIQF